MDLSYLNGCDIFIYGDDKNVLKVSKYGITISDALKRSYGWPLTSSFFGLYLDHYIEILAAIAYTGSREQFTLRCQLFCVAFDLSSRWSQMF